MEIKRRRGRVEWIEDGEWKYMPEAEYDALYGQKEEEVEEEDEEPTQEQQGTLLGLFKS